MTSLIREIVQRRVALTSTLPVLVTVTPGRPLPPGLGRAHITGSIAAGKQADLVVIDGDPSVRIDDIRKVSLVFKQGIAYDPVKLITSVRGRVGLY